MFLVILIFKNCIFIFSKNWRHKIESWFQENEKIEKNSELKRRLKEHRKSLDLETSANGKNQSKKSPNQQLEYANELLLK